MYKSFQVAFLFVVLCTGKTAVAQDCDTRVTKQTDGKLFHTPWLPEVKHPIKVTVDADETIIYLSNKARALEAVDEFYRISLDGTLLGLGSGSDATSIFLGEARVQRDFDSVDFLTSGTDVDIWIDVFIDDFGSQRIDITRGDNNEYVISWVNQNPSTFVDIRYIGTWNWGSDAVYRYCDIIPILRSRNQPTAQSSVNKYEASNAVDGNDNTDIAQLSCSLTNDDGAEAWWRVDLGEEYDIKMVILINAQNDAYSYRLNNAKVLVGSCPVANREDNKECGGAVTSALDRIPILKSCEPNTYGQYVYVDSQDGILSLCEVKVYGEIIPDDQKTKLYFTDLSYSADETRQSYLPISIGRSGTYQTCSAADISITDGTATRNVDYSVLETSVVFGLNDDVQDIRLLMRNDDLAEPSEDLTAALISSSFTGATPGSQTSVQVTIQDDDSVTYRFTQSVIQVKESDRVASIEVTREGGTANAGDVVFIIALGSALPLSDYGTNQIQLRFDPDVTKQTGEITIADDTIVENLEQFTVTMDVLTSFGDIDPNNDMVTVTIADDDDVFYLETTAIEVSEDETPEIIIRREGALELLSEVDLYITSGTAKPGAGGDYDSANFVTLQFGYDQHTVRHEITLIDDVNGEEDEEFRVELRTDAGQIKDGRNKLTVTIRDNDARYILESTFYSVLENQPIVQIAVLRIGYTGGETSARISTTFISAGNSDFTSLKYYPVTFGPSVERRTVDIIIQDDPDVERLETFNVFIEEADGAIGTPSTAQVVIIDNDGRVNIERSTYSVSENDAFLHVEVSRQGELDNQASVRLLSSTITATSEDFNPVDETIVFPISIESIIVRIRILEDFTAEEDERFLLVLNSAVNMTLGETTQATVTIVDSSVTYDTTTPSAPVDESGSSLPIGAVIGIAVAGGVVALLALATLTCFIYLRISRARAPMKANSSGFPSSAQQQPQLQQQQQQQQQGFANPYGVGQQMQMQGGFTALQAAYQSQMSASANQMAALTMPSTYREFSNGVLQQPSQMPYMLNY